MDDILSVLFYKFQAFILALNTTEIIVKTAEIVVLCLIVFFLYRRYIKGTSSENLIRGVLVLIFMWILSELFIFLGLTVFGTVLRFFVAVVIFSLIVVFQPELRRFLVYLGQGNLLARLFAPKTNKEEAIILTIISFIRFK